MKKNDFIYLIYQQLQGTLDSSEEQMLSQWLEESEENRKIKEDIQVSMKAMDDYNPKFPIDTEADYAKLRQQMDIPSNDQPKVVQLSSRRKWISVAAAVTLFLVSGFLIKNMITPKQEWLVLETNTNETRNITLSDGSQVWLNENSQLKYTKEFSGKNRNVELIGEAFFDIAKDPDKTFKIDTKKSMIKVLGTSFNVRALPNEPNTSVLVKTGKVEFSAKNNDVSTKLTANQKATLQHTTTTITMGDVENLNELAWHSDRMSFNSASLPEIVNTLEKHFKIKFNFDSKNLKKCPDLSLTPRKHNLEQILNILEDYYQLDIQKKSETEYVIKGGNC